MARWDWIRWIRAVKSPETRQKHIEVALDKLRACFFGIFLNIFKAYYVICRAKRAIQKFAKFSRVLSKFYDEIMLPSLIDQTFFHNFRIAQNVIISSA